jgi:hypothetical protein
MDPAQMLGISDPVEAYGVSEALALRLLLPRHQGKRGEDVPLTETYEGPDEWGVPLYDAKREADEWQRHLQLLERERTEQVH